MTNKDLISQYVDTGMGIPRYQYDKLSSNDKRTYLRKIGLSIEHGPNNIQYYYGVLPHELQMKAFEKIPRDNDFDLRYWLGSLVDSGNQICDELQLELVKLDPMFITSIKNQSEEAQMVFVRKAFEEGDKDLLRYLKEPTDNVLRLIIELSDNLNQYKER
jgi:hypothetical protein